MKIEDVKKFIEEFNKHCNETYPKLSSDKGCLECELYDICFNLQRIDKTINKGDKHSFLKYKA